MATAFYQTISQVPALRDAGYAGQALSGDRSETRDAINANPLLAHKVTATPGGGFGVATYGYTIGGYAFSVTTSSAATDAPKTSAEIAAAHNADPTAGAEARATVVGNDVVLTSWFAGASSQFTFVNGALITHAVSQTGADAAAIPFGKAVVYLEANAPGGALSSSQAAGIADEYCALPSALGAPSIVIDYSATSGTTIMAVMEVDGVPYMGFGTGGDIDAANTALVASLNASYGSTIAAIDAGADTVTLTGEKGQKLSISIAGDTGFAYTSANLDDALELTLLGVSAYSWDTDNNSLGTATTEYLPGEGVKIISRGSVLVALSGSPSRGDKVFIDGSGDFHTAAAAGRTLVPQTRAQWRGASVGGVAILDLL